MFIELSEFLRCPAQHDEAFCVVMPLEMVGRSVVRGVIGCSNCRREYPVVQGVAIFDLYQGQSLPAGKKSLAFRVVMQDTERTLTDAEADSARQALVELWGRRFGAKLRA